MASSKKYTFVAKDDYLSVVVDGVPFQILSTHSTFSRLKDVLLSDDHSQVPSLVNAAKEIEAKTAGRVRYERGQVYYQGRAIDSSLTRYIVEVSQRGLSAEPFLKFMDNLYKNPDHKIINELFDYINKSFSDDGVFPITDDGCFVAYKAITREYKDCHTQKIDNHPGQVVRMARAHVDPNRNNYCSVGYHFCSRSYLRSFNGDRIVMLKINPRDVVSIPADYGYAKGRCCGYEVIKELTSNDLSRNTVAEKGAEEMKKLIIPLAEDRQTLLTSLLENALLKRRILKGQVAETTIRKMTFGRMQILADKLNKESLEKEAERAVQEKVKSVAPSLPSNANPMKVLREAAGVTLTEMGQALGVSMKAAWSAEHRDTVTAVAVDNWIMALQEITGRKDVSGPKPVDGRKDIKDAEARKLQLLQAQGYVASHKA